jgi:hypothetical protein
LFCFTETFWFYVVTFVNPFSYLLGCRSSTEEVLLLPVQYSVFYKIGSTHWLLKNYLQSSYKTHELFPLLIFINNLHLFLLILSWNLLYQTCVQTHKNVLRFYSFEISFSILSLSGALTMTCVSSNQWTIRSLIIQQISQQSCGLNALILFYSKSFQFVFTSMPLLQKLFLI